MSGSRTPIARTPEHQRGNDALRLALAARKPALRLPDVLLLLAQGELRQHVGRHRPDNLDGRLRFSS